MNAGGYRPSLLQRLVSPFYDFLNEADFPAFDSIVLGGGIMITGITIIVLAYIIGAITGMGTRHVTTAHPHYNKIHPDATRMEPHRGPQFQFGAQPLGQGNMQAYAAPVYGLPQSAQYESTGIMLGSAYAQNQPHPFGRPRNSHLDVAREHVMHVWHPFQQQHWGEAQAAPVHNFER